MESVAAIEELKTEVRRRMADATITVDPPSSTTGSWWLDIQRYGHIASIEWRPGRGFGVAYPGGGYGEGVDFVVDDAATAAEHVSRQFESASSLAAPDAAVKLAATLSNVENELRELRLRVFTVEHELLEITGRTSKKK